MASHPLMLKKRCLIEEYSNNCPCISRPDGQSYTTHNGDEWPLWVKVQHQGQDNPNPSTFSAPSIFPLWYDISSGNPLPDYGSSPCSFKKCPCKALPSTAYMTLNEIVDLSVVYNEDGDTLPYTYARWSCVSPVPRCFTSCNDEDAYFVMQMLSIKRSDQFYVDAFFYIIGVAFGSYPQMASLRIFLNPEEYYFNVPALFSPHMYYANADDGFLASVPSYSGSQDRYFFNVSLTGGTLYRPPGPNVIFTLQSDGYE